VPWEKDGFIAHDVWGMDKSRVNLGIPFFFFNFTDPRHVGEPTWASMSASCPNLGPDVDQCQGVRMVSKEQCRSIGAWVAAQGFRGVFPWAANYDSLTHNNTLITWVNQGLGRTA